MENDARIEIEINETTNCPNLKSYRECNEDKNTNGLRPNEGINFAKFRPMSDLDFTYASANSRPEPKFGERVSQSAACLQMMSHQGSIPYETLP